MTTAPTTRPKGKPRKRATPVWRRRWFRSCIIAVLLVSLGGSGWWAFRTGVLGQVTETVKWRVIAASAHAGLRIDDVLVVGRKNTKRDILLHALGTARGSPILAFDVTRAKQRVEALPWVRRASVERMLPDTILLTVEERRPLALWQNDGQFALIDYEGSVIQRENLEQYKNLMIVIGPDAPRHTANLLEILGTQPEIMSLVRAAIRVGARRWNLSLIGGINVQLPEENATAAWMHLAQYQRSHGVLDRDVEFVDLRLPDRLIVRKAATGEPFPAALGQET
ncbi:MAG: FtsQ-type POTRA domain-containing protein [Rhodospirillales bacterium]|nr:FtsQ-type POTRA domain-containing protein [Rhodospirillales bacterium]